MNELTHIGRVADDLKVNPKTIRYYEEIKLIPQATRNELGHRMYIADEIGRLSFILRARQLEFTLDDIGEILSLRDDGEAPCLYVSDLVSKRILDVDQKIADLQRLRTELQQLDKSAQTYSHQKISDKQCICHLIENEKLRNSENGIFERGD